MHGHLSIHMMVTAIRKHYVDKKIVSMADKEIRPKGCGDKHDRRLNTPLMPLILANLSCGTICGIMALTAGDCTRPTERIARLRKAAKASGNPSNRVQPK